MQKIAFKTDEDVFNYLDQVSNVATLPEDERELYEDALKYARDRNAQMEYALEQGLEKGLEQGRKEGDMNARCVIARNLIDQGFEDDIIISITDITKDILTQIRVSKK